MKKNPVKYNLIHPATPDQNERELNGNILRDTKGIYHYVATFGRANGKLDCPFCGTANKVYVWSLAGGGKRCENCKAMFIGRYAYIPAQPKKDPQ